MTTMHYNTKWGGGGRGKKAMKTEQIKTTAKTKRGTETGKTKKQQKVNSRRKFKYVSN